MADHISGKDVLVSYRQNGTPRDFRCQSISIEEVAEEVADACNGEDRDRPQIITNLFKITIKAFTPDLVLMKAWLEDIVNNDAHVAPLNKVLGVRFSLLNGKRAAYKGREMARAPWTLDVSGRKERVMQNFGFRARYWDEVQAA